MNFTERKEGDKGEVGSVGPSDIPRQSSEGREEKKAYGPPFDPVW